MAAEIDAGLDVRLMRTLLILLTEQSVSRTADILNQTQPTVSAALKRLRVMCNDPLLVRDGNHLVLTERGAELKLSVARVLGDIQESFTPPVFNPDTERRFQILAAMCLGALFLPRLVGKIHALAPRSGLDFSQRTDSGEIVAALRSGALDLAIVNAPFQPDEMRMAPLLTTDLVCLVRQAHPLANSTSIQLEEYLCQTHMTCTPQPMMSLGPIDSQLAAMGRRRQITVSAPEFGLVPFIVAQSDLMFTTGRPFAEHLASIGPFRILEAPTQLEPMRFHMLWHERQHRAPAHKWLREMVRQTAEELQSNDAFRPARSRFHQAADRHAA